MANGSRPFRLEDLLEKTGFARNKSIVEAKEIIKDFLYNETTGLPFSYSDEEIDQKADIVYAHIFESYRGAHFSVYDEEVA